MLEHGQELFRSWGCTSCHGGYEDGGVWYDEGKGDAGSTPPLAYSDFFMAIRLRPVSILLDGYEGSITVNGLEYQGSMPSFGESMEDLDIAGIVTYIRVALNDSTVSGCDPNNLDEDGFATCVRTARDPQEIANDSIAVWEVTNVRNGVVRVAGAAGSARRLSSSFRVGGPGTHVFAVPASSAGRDVLRIVDAWGRTVWSAPVAASAREVRWNGAAANGRKVAPGVYHVRFEPRR